MNQYFVTISSLISFFLFVGTVVYFVGTFRKGKYDTSEATINILKENVGALKDRLDQTTLQITQLNSTITLQSAQITALQADNIFFKKLIQEALQMYFQLNNSSIEQVQEKLK